MVSFDVRHKVMYNVISDIVYSVIVISVFREIALYFVIYNDTIFISYRLHFCVFDRRQRIGYYRQTCDTSCKPTGHIFIMKSHLNSLIAVFVMHIMNDVQSVYIYLSQPFHHLVKSFHYFIVIQVFRSDRTIFRSYLFLAHFIHTAVDRIQQTFCQICTCSKELHLFTNSHGRYAAGDRIIIPVSHTHQIIIFILYRRRLDRSLCTEAFEVFRQSCRPQYRQVWFRSSSQVTQGMQITERHLCYHRTSVDTHTSDRLRYPGRISGEQRIVFRCSCKFYQTQLHNEVIDKLLNLFLCKGSVLQVTLCINIQESRSTSQRHRCSVLLLDCCQISKIQPLNRFLYVRCRFGNIKSVNLSQLFQFFQSLDLLRQLFSLTGYIRIHNNSCAVFLLLLVLDQTIHSVQRYSSVIADDTSATISIRQTSDDMTGTAGSHLRCICVKHTFIVSLSMFCKEFHNLRIYMISVIFAGFHCHTDTAVRLQGTFERLICLKSDNRFFVFIQISRTM
ncbi:uncharacterized protein BN747_01032 [Firmicutes bacterium CAG:646]|nr:uncharacterized protein BN747_01032 [Firmicutes bacterium CAG:646]